MNHPLFPAEDETDAPEVGAIHVTRHEGGSQRWAPRRFAAEDLRELSDIAELFGGGCYELIARSRDGSPITPRRPYTLAGPPLPPALPHRPGLCGAGCSDLLAPPRDAPRTPARPRYTPAGPPLPLDERDVPAPA